MGKAAPPTAGRWQKNSVTLLQLFQEDDEGETQDYLLQQTLNMEQQYVQNYYNAFLVLAFLSLTFLAFPHIVRLAIKRILLRPWMTDVVEAPDDGSLRVDFAKVHGLKEEVAGGESGDNSLKQVNLVQSQAAQPVLVSEPDSRGTDDELLTSGIDEGLDNIIIDGQHAEPFGGI